ncbi:MAG TPA: cytochrome b5 domain-containing protein [Coriobacteriia bacterium]
MKEFTAEELASYDGADGQPAYVAYMGVVYDVSKSAMWSDGDHEGMHRAGRDLTADHDDAPHDVHVTDFPEVGRLV